MQINVANPMLVASSSGLDRYTPIFNGESLNIEDYDSPRKSFDNLKAIIETLPRRFIASIIRTQAGTLIVFTSGETYLSLGLAIGDAGDTPDISRAVDIGGAGGGGNRVESDVINKLATIAELGGLGSRFAWRDCLRRVHSDHYGPISLDDLAPMPQMETLKIRR